MTTKIKKQIKKRRSRVDGFQDTMYVQIYEHIREGRSFQDTASIIGVSKKTLLQWKKTNPAVADAVSRARQRCDIQESQTESFLSYVYNRLPPELQGVWDRMEEWEVEENGIMKTEALLQNEGKMVRMHLFVHALVACDFNVSEACRKVNIPIKTLNYWITNEPDFGKIIEQIQIFKKDFFESALVRKVREGETSAIIFANKTYNRDRGYNEKVELEVQGNIQQTHVIDVSLLNLPLEIKRAILDAHRKYKQEQERLKLERQYDVSGAGRNNLIPFENKVLTTGGEVIDGTAKELAS